MVDIHHSEWIGRSEVARFVKRYGSEITRCERTGRAKTTNDGTFVVPVEWDYGGIKHRREAVVTTEDGLIARLDWAPVR